VRVLFYLLTDNLAASTILPIVCYFILGFTLEFEWYYGFHCWLAVKFGYPITRGISCAIHKHRMAKGNLSTLILTNLKWTPFFFLLYGCGSVPTLIAMYSHIFSYPITFAATKKEVEPSNIFVELPIIFKRFWITNLMCLLITMIMVNYPGMLVTMVWQIPSRDSSVTLPLIILVVNNVLPPILFNPWLWNLSTEL